MHELHHALNRLPGYRIHESRVLAGEYSLAVGFVPTRTRHSVAPHSRSDTEHTTMKILSVGLKRFKSVSRLYHQNSSEISVKVNEFGGHSFALEQKRWKP